MSEVYLGNPNLKKANTPIEFTQENIVEFLKCKNDPVYFANNYIKIVSLDEGLVPFKQYPFQKKLIKNFPSSINSYILLAEIFRMEYKFNDAERVLQKAIKTDPNHGDLLYNFSLLYFACRKLDNALTYINN